MVANEYPDGAVLIGRSNVEVGDLRAIDGGFRAVILAEEEPILLAGPPPITAAAPYWAPAGDDCFVQFRGPAHFDTCYKYFKMANDGSSTIDYWQVRLYGTMFAEGKKLKWGWLAVDQDAGPAQSFVDWDPTSDTDLGCQTTSLGVSVLGVGASYGYTQCEEWNISKSAGAAMGYFKNYWDWGIKMPLLDRDRGVALIIGTKGSPGSPTFGLSWDFATF